MHPVDRLEPFDPDRFFRDYWQQRPCLIGRWLKPVARPLDELMALAADHELPMRLVTGRQERADWTLRHGPLDHGDLPSTDRDWTVLVQEVDKACSAVAALLDEFRFLPDWMVDDIMISHAVDGGSVGAHVDAYDVFLVQAAGRRRWQLAESFDARIDERFELALLRNWHEQSEVVAGPGDTLYLPAGIAHHGLALDTCQTWSVGLRTPSGPELLFRLAEHLSITETGGPRLKVDAPDPRQPARVSQAIVDHARQLMQDCLARDDDELSNLLGEFLSGWRLWPQDPPATGVDEVMGKLEAGQEIELASSARLALSEGASGLRVHINGETLSCPQALSRSLAESRRLDARWRHQTVAVEQLLELGAIRL